MRRLGILVVLALAAVACKEKEPYRDPRTTPFGRDAAGPGPSARAPDAAALPATPPATPPVEPAAGPRPIAVVVTPEGSMLVSGAPGRDATVRRVASVVRVLPDGSSRTARVRVDPAPKGWKGKPSSFATVVLGGNGRETDALASRTAGRPDLADAAKADADLAPELYHREQLALLGMSGPVATWVQSVEGYLGGAHPYASKTVVSVDLEAGQAVDPGAAMRDRKLVAEVLGAKAESECVRHLAGVVPVEGPGGETAWLAALNHEFEVCAGALKLARVGGPGKPAAAPAPEGLSVADGTFQAGPGGPRVGGVLDWRGARAGDAAVLLMALGRDDRLAPPWQRPAGGDGHSRETRLWVRGMPAPVVLGRASTLVAVQFLLDHPAPEKVLKGWAGL